MIRARVFLVQQFYIIPHALRQRPRRRRRAPGAKCRGATHACRERLVRARRIRAHIQLHDLITAHREGVTPRHRRHDETRDPRAIRIRPILRQTLERRDELATARLVRVVRIRGERRNRPARDTAPMLPQHRAAQLVHASRIQPRSRNHLPRPRRARPFQLHRSPTSLLDVFQPDVHPLARLQIHLPAHLRRRGEKGATRDHLIIHPKPRPIIRRHIKRVEPRKLRLDLPRPRDGKRVRIRDRRPRRNPRAEIEIHRRIRARRLQCAEGCGVVILAYEPRPL